MTPSSNRSTLVQNSQFQLETLGRGTQARKFWRAVISTEFSSVSPRMPALVKLLLAMVALWGAADAVVLRASYLPTQQRLHRTPTRYAPTIRLVQTERKGLWGRGEPPACC